MSGGSFPQLEGTFSITTFITPPGAGAAEEPASATSTLETAVPAAEVTGAAP